MILNTTCSSCKEDIRVKSKASTRPDLQMERGTEFMVNCLKCGNTEKKHVNDVRAESSKLAVLIGFVVGVIVTIILFTMFGAIGTVSGIIPLLFWQQQTNASKAFNSYMVRRK